MYKIQPPYDIYYHIHYFGRGLNHMHIGFKVSHSLIANMIAFVIFFEKKIFTL